MAQVGHTLGSIISSGGGWQSNAQLTFTLKDVEHMMKYAVDRSAALLAYSELVVIFSETGFQDIVTVGERYMNPLAKALCEYRNYSFEKSIDMRMYDDGDFNLIVNINV